MATPNLNTLAKVASEIRNKEETQPQDLTLHQKSGQTTSTEPNTSSVEHIVCEPDILDIHKPPKKRFRPIQTAPTTNNQNGSFTHANPNEIGTAGGPGATVRPVVLRLNMSGWKENQFFRQLRGIPWEYQGELNGYVPHQAYIDTLGGLAQQVIWSPATCKENTTDEPKLMEKFEVQAAEIEAKLAEELAWHLQFPDSCRSPKCDCVSSNPKDQSIYERIKSKIELFSNPVLKPKVLLGLREQLDKADKWTQSCKEKQTRFAEKCQSMENNYRKHNLSIQRTALIEGHDPLPIDTNIETWAYCHLLKVRFVYRYLVNWMINKQFTLQNLISIYQNEMDREEISQPLLGFDEQLKARTSSTLQRRQKTQSQLMKRQVAMYGHVTPPSIFDYYSWDNIKFGNQEFQPAEFQLTSRNPHVTNQFQIPTVIMPVVRQLHQQGDVKGNLYVRYSDLIRVMGLLNYAPKKDLEKPATNVAKFLQSSLRQDTPVGFKCFPISGNTNFRTLLACHQFEKKINAAADLPSIVINTDVELVETQKRETLKRYLPLDGHFVLQARKEATASDGAKEADDAFQMLGKIHHDLTETQVVECTNFAPDHEEIQELHLVQEISNNHPTSVWEKKCALPAALWKKIHAHSDRLNDIETYVPEEKLTTAEINKVTIALTSMFQFIWNLYISEDDKTPVTGREGGAVTKPLYGFGSFMKLMSALQSSTVISKHKRRQKQLGQQWLCAYCNQTEILIKAVCQQYSNDHLSYANAMHTANQQTNSTRYLLNEVTNDVRHINQMRLNNEYDANRLKTNLSMQNQKVRKITEDRRHAIEDLAVLLSDTILHNAHVSNGHFKIRSNCKSINIIQKYLKEMDKNNQNIPKTHDQLVKLVKERLLAGFEFGDPEERNPYITPQASKIPAPSTEEVFVNLQILQPPINQPQVAPPNQMSVEQIYKTTRRTCYQGMLDNLPNIYAMELTQLARLLEHAKEVLIYADRAGVPEEESRKVLARRLYDKYRTVPCGVMFERFMLFRNQSNQGKSEQVIHNTAKYLQGLPADEDSILLEVKNIFMFLEQEVIRQVQAKALQSTSTTDDSANKQTGSITPTVEDEILIDVERIESEEDFDDVDGDDAKKKVENTSQT